MKKNYFVNLNGMITKGFLLALVLINIQGCARFTPVPDGYEGPLATVMDSSERVTSTKMYFFQLAFINGRGIKTSSQETRSYNSGMGLQMTPWTLQRMVPAEKSIARIQAVTYFAAPILAIGGGLYWVEGEVEVDIKPNKEYVVNGELSKDYKAVWIETLDREIVTEKIEIKGSQPAKLINHSAYK